MTRVDFYVTPNQHEDACLQLACRIAEKAYNQSNRVYIHADDLQQASKIDDMLWTFRQGSFIPHCLMSDENIQETAIVIGHDQLPAMDPQVLINLAERGPGLFYTL